MHTYDFTLQYDIALQEIADLLSILFNRSGLLLVYVYVFECECVCMCVCVCRILNLVCPGGVDIYN